MEKGELTAMMVIHVDDCAIAGRPGTVSEIKKSISKQLSIKDEGLMSKHLGIHYEWNADGSLDINQYDYVKDIVNGYEDKFGEVRRSPTPGYPGKTLFKNEENQTQSQSTGHLSANYCLS